MKLYVWVNPYGVSFGCSMLYAVASSIEEARAVAKQQTTVLHYGEYEEQNPGVGSIVDSLREPTRVLDLPCAEWVEWAE